MRILLTDSTTFYTKDNIPAKTRVLFILFDPGCSHCQKESEELVSHKESFNDIQVLLIAMPSAGFEYVNDFVRKYRLNELKHLVVGRDIHYFMPSFYSVRHLPFMALYDKKGNLITAFEGAIGIRKVIEAFRK
jgi:thioredoxin-related protein